MIARTLTAVTLFAVPFILLFATLQPAHAAGPDDTCRLLSGFVEVQYTHRLAGASHLEQTTRILHTDYSDKLTLAAIAALGVTYALPAGMTVPEAQLYSYTVCMTESAV